MKVRYEATIPTGTYANIRPVIEDATFDEALDHFIHIAKTCSDNPKCITRRGLEKK